MLDQQERDQERPPTIQDENSIVGSSGNKRNRAAQVNPFHPDQVRRQEKTKHPPSI